MKHIIFGALVGLTMVGIVFFPVWLEHTVEIITMAYSIYYIGEQLVLPITVNTLANREWFFTRISNENMGFVMVGPEKLYKIVHQIAGNRLEIPRDFDTARFVESQTPDTQSWWTRKYGVIPIGPPWIYQMHLFPITKLIENPDADPNDPKTWTINKGRPLEKQLQFIIIYPALMKDVELGDGSAVHLLVICTVKVVMPYRAIFGHKGKFFDLFTSTLRASTIDILSDYQLDDFLEADKDELDGILAELKDSQNPTTGRVIKSQFNLLVEEEIGIHLQMASITQWDPADQKVKDALNRLAIARQAGKADVAEAQYYAEVLAIKSGADRDRLMELAKGFTSELAAMKKVLRDASPDVRATIIGDFFRTRAVASDASKIQTWVERGGGTIPTIPITSSTKFGTP